MKKIFLLTGMLIACFSLISCAPFSRDFPSEKQYIAAAQNCSMNRTGVSSEDKQYDEETLITVMNGLIEDNSSKYSVFAKTKKNAEAISVYAQYLKKCKECAGNVQSTGHYYDTGKDYICDYMEGTEGYAFVCRNKNTVVFYFVTSGTSGAKDFLRLLGYDNF